MILNFLGPKDPELTADVQRLFPLNDDTASIIIENMDEPGLLAFALSCKRVFALARPALRKFTYARTFKMVHLLEGTAEHRLHEQTRIREPCYSPAQLLSKIYSDPLIAQSIVQLGVSLLRGSLLPQGQQGTTTTTTVQEQFQHAADDVPQEWAALMHFLYEVTFLNTNEKILWLARFANNNETAPLLASIVVWSTLPNLRHLTVNTNSLREDMGFIRQFSRALRNRHAMGPLLNASSLFHEPRTTAAHQLSVLYLEGPGDRQHPLPDPQKVHISNLIDLCLIPEISQISVEGVVETIMTNAAGQQINAFAWPRQLMGRSGLEDVILFRPVLGPQTLYNFVCGLPLLLQLELFDEAGLMTDDWIDEFCNNDPRGMRGKTVRVYSNVRDVELAFFVERDGNGESIVMGEPHWVD